MNIFLMYANGLGVARNDAEAEKWWRKANDLAEAHNFKVVKRKAEQGDAEAQYRLAGMYCNGEGVAEDNAECVKWNRKSAEQGYAPAQLGLGVLYAIGHGVAQDFSEAVKWWELAAREDEDVWKALEEMAEQGVVEVQKALETMKK